MIDQLIDFIRSIYRTDGSIPLHSPIFRGHEKRYVVETIDSTFVSSVGKFVDRFEADVETYTGCSRAVATVNGTAALHAALYAAGVRLGDLVITQSLTFVATCNALHHLGAKPVFVDVSRKSLGLCPAAMEQWLIQNASLNDEGQAVCKTTGRIIKAVVPMHTFGHPVELDELVQVCQKWHLALVEDAAESLGSFYKGRHTGTIGEYGVLSFNGNKIITTGGGGMVLCRDKKSGAKLKHLTTTAKVSHPYEFFHDEPAFNYRLPNLNAALGCAQMELLPEFLERKRALATRYAEFFKGTGFEFVLEPEYAQSNYWLNAVVCPDEALRNTLLETSNSKGIMTRPVWTLMHKLPMFQNAPRGNLPVSSWLECRLVNLPSTPVFSEAV